MHPDYNPSIAETTSDGIPGNGLASTVPLYQCLNPVPCPVTKKV